MAGKIVVDTSGFYARLAQCDDKHDVASAVTARTSARRDGFVTTDYVLDEMVTLLKARRLGHLIEPFFDSVLGSHTFVVEWI